MSLHINHDFGIFRCGVYHRLLLLVLMIHLAPTTYSVESGSRYYYENKADNSQTISAPGEADEIPLEFFQQLNNITDMSEFIHFFDDKNNIDPKLGVQENSKRNVERANFVKPEVVGCQPVSTIVPLTPISTSGENTNEMSYWPTCTYVMRCSDCCESKKVGCQPVETEIINFRVIKFVYGNRKLAGYEIIPVEKHLSCSVQCRTKAEHCKSFQVYRPDLCSCICKSSEDTDMQAELIKCSANNVKIWDDQNCRCLCRENLICTTGTVFDETDCKCVESKSSLTPEERRRFIVRPTIIEPDNSTIYDV